MNRLLVTALILLAGLPAHATDLETVEGRLVAQLLGSSPSIAVIQGYQSSMLASGLWSDINYTDRSQTNWKPIDHLSRLYAMAQGYGKTGTVLSHDAALKSDILKGYDAWFAINPYPTSTNWWFQDIGAAQVIGNIMVLMKADLSAAQITKGAAKITANPDAVTGLNLVDEATAKITKGIAQGNSTTVSQGFASIGSVIKITTGEGIQRDGTFLQHGPQLYNYGYGSGFISSVLSYSVLAAGTSYQITAAQQKILADYILDGSQQMIRGEAFDYTAFGRGLSRNSPSSAGNSLITPATNAMALGTYRADELATLVTRQTDSRTNHTASPALAYIGHRHFWRGDLTTHQRQSYYTSVKISSTRTSQPESGNGEGLKNLYLGDGVNQIMRTGNEYDDIMPVWDWRRLPGTTVEQNSVTLKPSADWGVKGTATYAGGVSDGFYGATAFNYSRGNVSAKKSWFHFDNEFAALGTAINASASTAPVFTTLNQCLLNGTVTYKAGSTTSTLAIGNSVTPSSLWWVHHDGVGYFFPTSVSNATIKSVAQSGTWLSLNTGGSGTTISKDVFSLYLSQAAGVTGGSYHYLVVPGIAVGEMDAYLAANPIQVLRNDGTAQATCNTTSDITQSAFFAAGMVTLASGETLAANDKAVVQIRRQPNELQVTAASPEARTMVPQFTLSGMKLTGASWFEKFGSALATTNLLGGDLAGSSVGYTLTNDAAASPTVTLAATTGSAAVSHTVTAAITLPADTIFETDANSTLGFNSVISGDFNITKTGSGILNLAGANTYGGGTSVTAGTVNVAGNQAAATGSWIIGSAAVATTNVNFQAGSIIGIATDQQLRLANNTATGTATQTLNVVGTVTNAGSLYVGRPGVLNLNAGAAWTQGGTMSVNSQGGPSSFLNVNTGSTFTYTGANTIKLEPGSSGSGVINLGGTFLTHAGFERTLATSTGGSRLTFAGGTLTLGAAVPLLATSNVEVSTDTLGGTINTNGFDTTLPAAIVGTGRFTKAGAGALTLAASNSMSGGLIIANNGGTLIATIPGALGIGTITIAKSGISTGTLAFQFLGTNIVSNAFAGFKSTTFTGETTLPCILNLSGDNTISGDLTVTSTGGNGLAVKSDAGFLTLVGTITQTVGTIRGLELGGTGNGLVSGPILDATGGFSLTKTGSGTWSLTGPNTYQNGTTVSNGTLRIGNGGSLGSGPINNNARLVIDRSDSITLENPIRGTGDFIQVGSGVTTLSAANTYTGDTIVEHGTLSLTQAYLSNTADVNITTGATLILSHGAVDTIDEFFIDGIRQKTGTWGALGSGANHETELIGGSGKLLVTTGEASDLYLAWIAAHALGDSDAAADFDADGLSNFLEYALGTDPKLPTPPLVAVIEGSFLTLTYKRNLSATDTILVPEWSDDLTSWHPEDITQATISEIDGIRTVKITLPMTGNDRIFLHLRASRP